MKPGQLVFPLTIATAFFLLAGFVATHPAQSLPERDLDRPFAKVAPGDELLLEVTGYYGAQGWVFVTTQEERYDAGEFATKLGPIAPQRQSQPVRYALLPQTTAQSPGLDGFLIDKRTLQTYTTPKFEPRLSFGDWEGVAVLNRTLDPLPLRVTFDAETDLGFGGRFNLDQYKDYWNRNGFPNLGVGTVFPCEGPERWSCVVERLEPDAGLISYRRNVASGDEVPIDIALEGAAAEPPLEGRALVRVDDANGQIFLTWEPVVGNTFTLRQNVPGFLSAGTYRIQELRDDTFISQYTSDTRAPAHLVGEAVWYEVVITQIRPRATATA